MNNFPNATFDNLIDMFRRTDIVLSELDGIEKAAGSVENISDVIGQSFSAVPDTFKDLRSFLADEITARVESSFYGIIQNSDVIQVDSRVCRFELDPVDDIINELVNCSSNRSFLKVLNGTGNNVISFSLRELVTGIKLDDGSYQLTEKPHNLKYIVRGHRLIEVGIITGESVPATDLQGQWKPAEPEANDDGVLVVLKGENLPKLMFVCAAVGLDEKNELRLSSLSGNSKTIPVVAGKYHYQGAYYTNVYMYPFDQFEALSKMATVVSPF